MKTAEETKALEINFSVHACIEKPTAEMIETDGPDAGWLAINFPERWVADGIFYAWFGIEENCAHNYCARIDFKAIDPHDVIDLLENIEGIENVGAEEPHNAEGTFWSPCDACGIGPFDNRDEPGDSLMTCNDCLAHEEYDEALKARDDA